MEQENVGKTSFRHNIAEKVKRIFTGKKAKTDSMRLNPQEQARLDAKFLSLFKDYYLNTKTRNEMTADKLQTFERMLKQGANPNLRWEEKWEDVFGVVHLPLLFEAIFDRDINMVALLLKYKADPNVKDGDGNTPLYWARNSPLEITKLLEENGARWPDWEELRKIAQRKANMHNMLLIGMDKSQAQYFLETFEQCIG